MLHHAVLHERNGSVLFVFVDEYGGIDGSNSQCRCVIDECFVVNDLERVSHFDVEEVDLPSVDICYLHCQQRRCPVVHNHIPKGRADVPFDIFTLDRNILLILKRFYAITGQVYDRIICQRFGKCDVLDGFQRILCSQSDVMHSCF